MTLSNTPKYPRLIQCASPWSMHDWPSKRREWALAQKLDAIDAAGFDGVCAYVTPELKAGADQRGLVLMSGFDCGDLAVAKPRLEA